VEIEEPPLTFGKAADVYHSLSFDTHSRQRWPMGHRRDDQLAGILEADKPAIKDDR
jgi:hypothetical protein